MATNPPDWEYGNLRNIEKYGSIYVSNQQKIDIERVSTALSNEINNIERIEVDTEAKRKILLERYGISRNIEGLSTKSEIPDPNVAFRDRKKTTYSFAKYLDDMEELKQEIADL